MNKELLLKSDVLDIIFEHRNKAYGAYDLRKYYDQRMQKAIGIMLGFAAIISAFSFLHQNTVEHNPYHTVLTAFANPKPKEKLPDIKPKVKVVPPGNIAPASVPLIPVIVSHIDSSVKQIENNLPTGTPNNSTANNLQPTGPATVTPVGTGIDLTINTTPVKPKVDKNIPLDHPEIMPAFPCGWDALRKFLERNLQNPREMEEGEMVSVKIRFVVGYDGKLQRFEIAQDGGMEFNKEVIRVLKKMPEWIPGKTNGENVSVYYTIPVKFIPAE